MKATAVMTMMLVAGLASLGYGAGDYRGDERCPLPKDWNNYSEPYQPLEHPTEYPTFYKADWPGWSCSYQRPDGVIVQYGDSRSPQQQWIDTYTGNGDSNN